MNIEETMKVFSNILDPGGFLKVAGIHEENHDPHPFTIGPKHEAKAASENEGVLSEEICEAIPCAAQGCNLKYSEHKSTKTLILQLRKNQTQESANIELIKIKSKLIQLGIEKVAFAENEGEKYKFI